MGDKTDFEGCITHGPWGGPQGESWVYMPKGFIKEIMIAHKGGVIDSVIFVSDGFEQFGATVSGGELSRFPINLPDEYLTSISGRIGTYKESLVVKSLYFWTNKRSFGTLGPVKDWDSGIPFSYDGKGGMVVGFFGRASEHLNAIGIYVMPKPLALSRTIQIEDNSSHESSKMSKEAMRREVGPWGGSGGEPWDDGVFSTVKQIHVLVEESLNVIYSIQFLYDRRDGKSVLSPMHGGACRDKMELVYVVNLDGTDEYLTAILGFYGPVKGYDGVEAITSITFHTNKRKHGPYGEESNAGHSPFTSTSSGKVVGFHGRSDGFLSAIGVHMEYF